MRKTERIYGLSDRMKQLLKESHLSITEFSESIGISRQSVGFYLNGNRQPSAEHIKKICESLNVSADWLLGLSDDL